LKSGRTALHVTRDAIAANIDAVEKIDVAIVGCGIIGCSIAFELAAEKLKIVILDRQQPGREASWAAAGMLSPAPDSPRDIPLVPLARESLSLYPEFVRAVEEASGRTVGYTRKGALQIFIGPSAEAERGAMLAKHRGLGLASEPVSGGEARKLEPALGPAAHAVLYLPKEETVDPRLLMEALLAAAANRRVEIRSGWGVSSLIREGNCCKGVVAGGESIHATHVIVAAGCFSAAIGSEAKLGVPLIPTRPVRGQMLALLRRGLAMQHVLRSERGYLVPRSDGRIVAGSTLEEAGFDKSVTALGVKQIMESAVELCPDLAEAETLEKWSGLRPGTPDDLPILGLTETEGLILATGHYRNGILLAPVTAKLVGDWVLQGRTSFDTEAFSPGRFQSANRESAIN
jgi:glycine oxidase